MDIIDIFERDGRGYNQIARDTGLAPSVVWRIVNGKTRKPSIQTARKLAVAFGVELEDIYRALREQNAVYHGF